MRITKRQLKRIVRESLGSSTPDYDSAKWQMDKWMPDDPEIMNDYFELEDSLAEFGLAPDRYQFISFLEEVGDEDRFQQIAGPGASYKGFAEWIVWMHY